MSNLALPLSAIRGDSLRQCLRCALAGSGGSPFGFGSSFDIWSPQEVSQWVIQTASDPVDPKPAHPYGGRTENTKDAYLIITSLFNSFRSSLVLSISSAALPTMT